MPQDLKRDVDLTFLRAHLAALPIPLVRLPTTCVEAPWGLIYLAHELGHHVQYRLLQRKLVDDTADLIGNEARRNQVARDVTDPQKGVSVAERLRAGRAFFAPPEDRKAAIAGGPFHLDPLGSGSDFTPFLQHLTIASINLGYGGEEEYGQYHSIYGSFDHYVRFMDTDFSYGVALAKTGGGRLVLRLSEAEVLPIEFTRLADEIGKYADEVVKLADQIRTETEERAKLLDQKIYETFDDPTKTWVAPKRHEPVPYLNFAPLQNAVATLRKSAQASSARSAPRRACRAVPGIATRSTRPASTPATA